MVFTMLPIIEGALPNISKAFAILCWLGAAYALGRWLIEDLGLPIKFLQGESPISNNPDILYRFPLLVIVGFLLAILGISL